MKFAMFFMAEYANMFTVACLASILFLGGWSGPVFGPPILQSLLPVFGSLCGCLLSCLFTSGCAARCRVSAMTS